jgi:hypothetical protein
MATAQNKPQHKFNDTLFKAYEDGKHRRYSLLFSVNGGAFAVAKLLGEKGANDAGTEVAGNLTLAHLAIGMMVFTAIMSFDILMFGLKMREEWKNSEPHPQPLRIWKGMFALPGWFVLGTIWLLISAGWRLVAT